MLIEIALPIGAHVSLDVLKAATLVEAAFPRGVACLPAEKPGNVVVFGFNSAPGQPRWEDLRHRARDLEQRYGLDFGKFVGALARLNAHDDKRLLI